MKKRIFYLLRLFIIFLFFFGLQKILFFYVNIGSSTTPLSVCDLTDALWHGLGLDMATSGYLIVLPFLVVWFSVCFKKCNHQLILRPYYILVALLLSTICVVDTSLYSFWKFKLDATIFNYIDSPKQALASVDGGYIAWRVIWTLVFTTLFAWILTILKPKKFPPLAFHLKQIGYHLTFIFIGGLIFLAIRGGIGRSTMNIGSAYFSENTYLNHTAINPAFNLIYSWRKTEDFSKKYNFLEEDKRAALYADLYPQDTEDCTTELLKNKRPNILLILLEGFGGNNIASLGGIPNIAPHFESLIKEGIFFEQVYANSFRTDRGLVSALSGHVSYPTTSIMKIPAKSGKLPGIAASLVRNGYQTDFVYGGDINFTNMKSYFTTTGYQQLTYDTHFSLSERNSSSWGAHDEYAFQKVLDMIQTRPKEQLWHTTLLTLSSHEPFEVPYQRLENKRQNAFAYTDYCLGDFINKLKRLPVWENLLVICIPDHGSLPTLNTTSPAFYHIPMLWLGGAIKTPMVISTLMNQSDFPATLLGQLGIQHQEFRYSRNIFSEKYVYPFAYSSYNDGFMFMDSTGVTIYDNVAKRAVYEKPQTNHHREERGKAILQTSYDHLGEL